MAHFWTEEDAEDGQCEMSQVGHVKTRDRDLWPVAEALAKIWELPDETKTIHIWLLHQNLLDEFDYRVARDAGELADPP